MYELISKDIIDAMKTKQKERLEALRFFKSLLIENKTAKAPIEEMDVLIKHIKKLHDNITMYPEGSEQREKLKAEISFLAVYQPTQLSEDDVKAIIQDIKAKNAGANLGIVMKELTAQIKGKFDGKRASELVKESLS